MLKNLDHCQFCDNQKKDFTKGVYCGLTNEKPEFHKTCSKIKLDQILIKKIEEINSKHYKLINRKFDIYAGLLVFPILGLLVLFGDYLYYTNYYKPFFLDELNEPSKAIAGGFALLAILFVAGITLIGKGTGPLINYLESLKYIKKDKAKLDAVCRLNGYKYDIAYYKKNNLFDLEVRVKDIKLRRSTISRN